MFLLMHFFPALWNTFYFSFRVSFALVQQVYSSSVAEFKQFLQKRKVKHSLQQIWMIVSMNDWIAMLKNVCHVNVLFDRYLNLFQNKLTAVAWLIHIPLRLGLVVWFKTCSVDCVTNSYNYISNLLWGSALLAF